VEIFLLSCTKKIFKILFKMEIIEGYKTQNYFPFKLGFIGGGNMAFAIVKGIIESELFKGEEIFVSSKSKNGFEKWEKLGVKTTLSSKELISTCRIVFLCVKPAQLKDVSESLREETVQNPMEFISKIPKSSLVSILAGTSLKSIEESLPMFDSYIRAMPNTPLQVLAGCTAITKLKGHKTKDTELNFGVIQEIFKKLGIVEIIDDESKFHAITAISGSGPAYVYLIIEALSDACVKQGLPRDLSTRFAAQTLLGASKTVLETGLHPAQLKDQVTSSGGTTIHAIHELEKGNVRNTLFNAIEAATKRSKEMSKE
jgi:pyrroline-5-carboxylate reductase